MNPEELLKFAHISATTYDNPKQSKVKFKVIGFEIVEFFDVEGAQAYLLKGKDGTHVLSFRGTEVSQKSDILADLKAGKNLEACGGKVHVGFKGEINKVWPAIQKAIADIDSLYVTGHSLGAAMATIAASRIQSKVVALVTFGSPRVGNQEFIDSLKVAHYRVQNNCDDVTKQFVSFLLAQPNTHYLTSDEITPWGLISRNRIYNLDWILESLNQQNDEPEEETDEE